MNSKGGRESAISSTDDEVNTQNDIKYGLPGTRTFLISFSQFSEYSFVHWLRGENHVKTVSETLDKRRKSLVLNGETEGKIRDLYEK